MKKLLMIISMVLLTSNLFAQKVVSYDKNGKPLKSVSEYVAMHIENIPSNKHRAVPTYLAGVILGPVYNITSTAIKNSIEKRQKSFTASYSNSAEFPAEYFKQQGLKKLIINRYIIDSLDDVDSNNSVAEYQLILIPEKNSLSIELKSIFLERSKARYKKDDNLLITINVKATSIMQTEKDSVVHNEKMDSKSTVSEGTITIPIIKVTGKNQDFSDKTDVINEIKLNGISLATSNSIKFAITITETNITHIAPSNIQTVLMNSSSDIQTILKAIFGVSDK